MRAATAFFAFFAVLTFSRTAHGFIVVRGSQSGAEVHWRTNAQLTYRLNTTNASGMAADTLFSIFSTSLSRWKQAAFNGFNFALFSGTNTGKYPNYTGSTQDNSIFFTSNASANEQLSCGVIGLTQMWFDPGSGESTKADIRFNDTCFQFTNTPSDTSSQQRIYLADVATHELGHSLGLDHSQSLQSSMIYTAAVEMSKPGCDDHAAMVHLYGQATTWSTGTLAGTVRGPSGPVFGAHVNAIQLERGTALASAITQSDGTFKIYGLEAGHYAIVVEPYYPGAGPLNAYYAQINNNVCSGSVFNRTFAQEGGALASYAISGLRETNAGTITVSCSAPASLNGGTENSFAAAPVLAAGPVVDTPVATQGVLSGSAHQYFLLRHQLGHLVVNALAYSLFSRADVTVELLDTTGRPITQSAVANVFSSSASGYTNYDGSTVAELTSPQDVVVHVVYRGQIATSAFPSGATGVSATPYYVLTASSGPNPSATLYGLNARCASDDDFTAYRSPGDAPDLGSGQSAPKKSSGGCGTLSDDSDSDHDQGSPGPMLRLANFALMAAMLAMARRRMARG